MPNFATNNKTNNSLIQKRPYVYDDHGKSMKH